MCRRDCRADDEHDVPIVPDHSLVEVNQDAVGSNRFTARLAVLRQLRIPGTRQRNLVFRRATRTTGTNLRQGRLTGDSDRQGRDGDTLRVAHIVTPCFFAFRTYCRRPLCQPSLIARVARYSASATGIMPMKITMINPKKLPSIVRLLSALR